MLSDRAYTTAKALLTACSALVAVAALLCLAIPDTGAHAVANLRSALRGGAPLLLPSVDIEVAVLLLWGGVISTPFLPRAVIGGCSAVVSGCVWVMRCCVLGGCRF
jgi:hypothetical protein